MLINKLKAFFNPEQFQGWGKKRKYFEGWYFKVVNASETKAFAFIPGIAIDEISNRQAFIQVLDGKQKTSKYHKFEFESFTSVPGAFKIFIQNNHFSEESILLDLPGISGSLRFSNMVPWPKHWYSPGIMGPYAFVPFMECYHGIVSMDHILQGQIEINGELIDFNNGRGYIEKDWGQSFPSAYIWLQSNHFSEPGISVKISIAKIPWLGSSFVGFIAAIWLKNRLIQFTTYNKSKLLKSWVDPNIVHLIIESKLYRLEIIVARDSSSVLASPIRGAMDGHIEESMSSRAEIYLTDLKYQKLIFQDIGRNAALEVAGNINEILIP